MNNTTFGGLITGFLMAFTYGLHYYQWVKGDDLWLLILFLVIWTIAWLYSAFLAPFFRYLHRRFFNKKIVDIFIIHDVCCVTTRDTIFFIRDKAHIWNRLSPRHNIDYKDGVIMIDNYTFHDVESHHAS